MIERETERTLSRNKLLLGILFLSSAITLSLLVVYSPALTEDQQSVLFKVPHSPREFLDLITVLKVYCEGSYFYLLSVFSFFFVFLQSFGIPGPLILCIISGALFGRWQALLLVTLCSTIGSTMCYLLSETLGKGLIVRQFPKQVLAINGKIDNHRANLFYYILFLRLTPIIPNWLINLCAPIIGVNVVPFVIATFLGLVPANFLYISSGISLTSMQEVGLDYQSIALLIILGGLALIPTLKRNN